VGRTDEQPSGAAVLSDGLTVAAVVVVGACWIA